MPINFFDYQWKAIHNIKNGNIVVGGVGSGKSRTSIAYFCLQQGLRFVVDSKEHLRGGHLGYHTHMTIPKKRLKDLYIITTARKRDTLEWEGELSAFGMSTDSALNKAFGNKIVVDSWNNIKKYADVKDAFFIFDEQRVVGYGSWSKTFINIAKSNEWILLSATPGDTWMDYMPTFIANGFYKNKTEFQREHCVFSRFSKYPKIEKYLNTGKLERLRNDILYNMQFDRATVSHHEDVLVEYDRDRYKDIMKTRWDPYKNEPIQQASSLCYILRRLVNEDESRQLALLELFEKHSKVIIFYNFDYELEILRKIFDNIECVVAEWNGHKHEPVPDFADKWIYLVQYTAGAEGWNCVTTNAMIFYSQNYSYKIMHQSSGRIDRLNTPFKDLYYYHLVSKAPIDLAIGRALKNKKIFNERNFVKW